MNHTGTVKLETNRLVLRKIRLTDTKMVYNNWASDSEVTKYLTWMSHDSIDVTNMIVNMWVNGYKNSNFYQWGIVVKEDNQLIGTISSVAIDEKAKSIEVGYCISKKYWNKGYVSEALKAVIDYFFNSVLVHSVKARCDKENIGSSKVMEKCKMKYTHTTTDKNNTNNPCVCLNYEITKEEYNEKD